MSAFLCLCGYWVTREMDIHDSSNLQPYNLFQLQDLVSQQRYPEANKLMKQVRRLHAAHTKHRSTTTIVTTTNQK